MTTSLDKLENKVQIHHLHVKRFHMVMILRKSVQYVRRYSTNYACFWPYRTWRTQMSSIISGATRQQFTKFLHYIGTSSPLLTRTFRQWHCNSFANDSAKNASGISRRSWHFPKINWLPWQSPSTNRKTRYRSIICTQSAFVWWKDCKNRSSISWDIWLNMPVFCHVVKKYTNEPRFLWSYWTKVHEIFARYRVIICADNAPIEVAISHSVLDWQNDKCREGR